MTITVMYTCAYVALLCQSKPECGRNGVTQLLIFTEISSAAYFLSSLSTTTVKVQSSIASIGFHPGSVHQFRLFQTSA